MIFARRRRPQVSAENQAMRTGEISKILSKEWVSMPPVIVCESWYFCLPPHDAHLVREAILSGASQAAEGDVQHKIPRLCLSQTPQQLKEAPALR